VTSTEIKRAIRRRFRDQVQNVRQVPTQFGDHPFDRPDAVWARVTIIFGESTQVSRGQTKRFRDTGLVMIELFDPINDGDAELSELADLVCEAFRAVQSEGVTYATPRYEEMGRRDSEWQINVVCPFYADTVD